MARHILEILFQVYDVINHVNRLICFARMSLWGQLQCLRRFVGKLGHRRSATGFPRQRPVSMVEGTLQSAV